MIFSRRLKWDVSGDSREQILVVWSDHLDMVVAQVRLAGKLFRGTVFAPNGTSSQTWTSLDEAQDWCRDELRR